MNGKLFGIGVGPGDPELMTVKALRIIRESDVIAVPGKEIEESVAYQIVKGVYGELDGKCLIPVPMPMTKDPQELEENHRKAAEQIESCLKEGKQTAFLTLGDPTVYSTYLYVHKRIIAKGYEAEIVSGITSFCAAAARLNIGLTEMAEPLHIIPATYRAEEMAELLQYSGTKVLMKTGRKMKQVRESLLHCGQQVMMVENCGMDSERVYRTAEEIPEEAGYYSLIIVKENEE